MTQFARCAQLGRLIQELGLRPDVAVDFRPSSATALDMRVSVCCVKHTPEAAYYRFSAVANSRDMGTLQEQFTVSSDGVLTEERSNAPPSTEYAVRVMSQLQNWQRSERPIMLDYLQGATSVLAGRISRIMPDAPLAAPVTEDVLVGLRQLEQTRLHPSSIAQGLAPSGDHLHEGWRVSSQPGHIGLTFNDVTITVHTMAPRLVGTFQPNRLVVMALNDHLGARTPVDLSSIQAFLSPHPNFQGERLHGHPIGLALHFPGVTPDAHYSFLFAS